MVRLLRSVRNAGRSRNSLDGSEPLMSDRKARFERRLAERRSQQEQEETGATPPPIEDRRNADRRVKSMTPREVDDWLRRNGISGGDRRKGDRRRR